MVTMFSGWGARPNIVLIMADDMGYSDIGCYGGEIETPHLDRLAESGVRFSQFYNTGRCCPTRASLLTGLYSHQAGIGHMTGDRGRPAYQGYLNDRCLTIAEVLKPAGYTTMICGKWHVGSKPDQWPLKRGFDKFYGIPQGGGHYYRMLPGRQLVLQDEEIPLEKNARGENWYATEGFTDYAVRFIEEEKESDSPFFLYVAYTAPHWPLQARDRDIAKYAGRYSDGWDAVRQTRFGRMLDMGLLKSDWSLSGRDEKSVPWEDESEKKMMADRMAVYAAQVDALDQGIGKIVKALEGIGKRDDSVVIFLSDNGCSAEGGQKGFNNPKRGDVQARLGTPQSYVSAGLSWANACNTPFRKHKSMVHEGGIATPFIASWPTGITRKNRIEDRVGHVVDLMPTIIELAEVRYPTGKLPLEGTSLMGVLQGTETGLSTPRRLFWEHEGNRAVRDGSMKLVAAHKGDWELYDLSVDRTETDDLAERFPRKADELRVLYENWADRCGVLEWPVEGRSRKNK